jgi:hypothetical protein
MKKKEEEMDSQLFHGLQHVGHLQTCFLSISIETYN